MEFPLLASLPPETRRMLLGSVRRRTFARREVIIREGDLADSFHLVRSGRLGVRVSTSNGESAMLKLIVPGDYFGEVSLLEHPNPRRTATIVALEPAETWSISSDAFRALRARHPAVQEVVLAALAQRVDDLTSRLLEALYENLDHRVYRQLTYLADVYAEGATSGPVTVPVIQETLAEFVGATRPSVNAVLQRLEERRLVSLARGRIVVLDRAALRARLH